MRARNIILPFVFGLVTAHSCERIPSKVYTPVTMEDVYLYNPTIESVRWDMAERVQGTIAENIAKKQYDDLNTMTRTIITRKTNEAGQVTKVTKTESELLSENGQPVWTDSGLTVGDIVSTQTNLYHYTDTLNTIKTVIKGKGIFFAYERDITPDGKVSQERLLDNGRRINQIHTWTTDSTLTTTTIDIWGNKSSENNNYKIRDDKVFLEETVTGGYSI